MIMYRPKRKTRSLSLKEEQPFNSEAELIDMLVERMDRICRFIGSDEPFTRSEIHIGETVAEPILGEKLRPVSVDRIGKVPMESPVEIGFVLEGQL